MAKRKINIKDLRKFVGQEIGRSDWCEVTQEQVSNFAEATGDRSWVHLDGDRARKELPQGRTIVHNFLLLGLIPGFFDQVAEIEGIRYGLNRGVENVCFLHPLPTGSRIRFRLNLLRLEYVDQRGMTATFQIQLEREDNDKKVLSADLRLLFVTQ